MIVRISGVYAIRIALVVALAAVTPAPFMLNSQGDPTHTVIPAGNSAALGSTTAPAEDTPQSRMLHEALSKETRDTLQQAMNSAAH